MWGCIVFTSLHEYQLHVWEELELKLFEQKSHGYTLIYNDTLNAGDASEASASWDVCSIISPPGNPALRQHFFSLSLVDGDR